MRVPRSLLALALLCACAPPQERARQPIAERGVATSRRELIEAFQRGDAETVELLLAAGPTIPDALFRLVQHGHCE
ncbi:MAG: hypothetical protein ACRD0X_07865, partial [Thermoanaerobaculia bacterium]